MAYLDEERNAWDFDRIDRALKARGLHRDGEWQVHGPHLPDMPDVVYVGSVRGADGSFTVAVYPHAVYEVDDDSLWWRAEPRNRVPVSSK
jgi:hypothetical protein